MIHMIKTISPLLALALTGCIVESTNDATGAAGETGAALSVDYYGDTDVVGFHFEIDRVACDADDAFTPFSVEGNVDLVDGIFPAMIDLVSESPLDPDSRHLGADFFVTLEPGCYDVLAAPAASIDGDDWTPSSDCATAGTDPLEPIEVVDGATTEAPVLISQCVGDENGAADSLVVLNHAPFLVDLSIDEKFNYECEPVEVCATYYDVDDDPLTIDWANIGATAEWDLDTDPAEVIGFEDGHRVWQQCATIVTRYTTSYEFEVTVTDQGYEDGTLTDFEDITGEDSHDSMSFPIHTNWIEEPRCFDEDGDLVWADGVEIERAEGCLYVTAETFYCSGAYDSMFDSSIKEWLCDGTDLIEEALYPDCPAGTEVCDGEDNDGDGEVDEGFTTGTAYTYSDTNITSGTSDTAGTFDLVSSVYNSANSHWSFSTDLSHNTGTTDSFTIAISDGANPKGQSQLALVYVDCTGGATEPNITVYAYNGANTFTSYYDGSSTSGTQAPDKIVNSQDDSSFVVSSSCADDGTTLSVDFELDVSGINAHTPLYVAGWAWEGIMHGEDFGIWYHPWANGSFSYDSDGWITSASYAAQGWFDASYLTATGESVCVAE